MGREAAAKLDALLEAVTVAKLWPMERAMPDFGRPPRNGESAEIPYFKPQQMMVDIGGY